MFLMTGKWKGTGQFTLEKLCAKHCHSDEQLKLGSNHVLYQLPTDHTRVTRLIDAIDTTDPELLAALAAAKKNEETRNSFELTVAAITPSDPVARRINKKRSQVKIASVEEVQPHAKIFGIKSGIGKTGVHLRYHLDHEYKALEPEQKAELGEWRQTPEGQAAMAAEKAARGEFASRDCQCA